MIMGLSRRTILWATIVLAIGTLWLAKYLTEGGARGQPALGILDASQASGQETGAEQDAKVGKLPEAAFTPGGEPAVAGEQVAADGVTPYFFYYGTAPDQGATLGYDFRDSHPSNRQRLEAEVARLKQAESEEERQAARTALRELLDTIFSVDMLARGKQLTAIESRIDRLRREYREREEVKEQIIDLQLKVLENEAAGLGFPDGLGIGEAKTDAALDAVYRPGKQQAQVPAGTTGGAGVPVPDGGTVLLGGVEQTQKQQRQQQQQQQQGLTLQAQAERLHLRATGGRYRDGISVEKPIYISGQRIDAGDSKLIRLGRTTNEIEFKWGDISEKIDDPEPFDYVAVTWSKDGSISFVFFESTDETERILSGEGAARDHAGGKQVGRSVRQAGPPEKGSSGDNEVAAYQEIRKAYTQTRAALKRAEAEVNAVLAEVQRANPEATLDDVRKEVPGAWAAVQECRADWAAAQRLYEAKLKLLEIERQAAQAAFASAKGRHARLQELVDSKTVASSELEEQEAVVKAALLEIERIETLLDLFKSIADEGQVDDEPAAESTAEPDSGGGLF